MTFDVHGRPCPRCLGHGRIIMVSQRNVENGLWNPHHEVLSADQCPRSGEVRRAFKHCDACDGSGSAAP